MRVLREQHLTTSLLAAMAILVLIAVVSFRHTASLVRTVRSVAETAELLADLEAWLSALKDAETGQRGFLLSGDESYLAPYEAGLAGLEPLLARLKRRASGNPGQVSRLVALEKAAAERAALLQKGVGLRRTHGLESATRLFLTGQGRGHMEAIRRLVDEVAAEARDWQARREHEAQAGTWRTLLITMGGTAVSFALLAAVFLLLHREVASRRAAEEALRASAEHLEATNVALARKNEELRSFAYTISHDLKAPLRGIAGYAQELVRRHQGGLGARARFCTTQIVTAAKTLDRLIEDLLAYARLDQEQPTLSPVRLREMVDSLLLDRRFAIAEQGAEVTIEVPECEVQCWARGTGQALANVLDNALKYSRHAQPPRIRIAGSERSEGCLLSVADNGVGFDMQYHDRVFELFRRLVRQEDYDGTGAGLAIAKKLMDKQGGRIWAVSVPGAGATFFLGLPRQASPAARSAGTGS